MAMDFQQAMLMIHTQAGASAGEVKKLSGAVLNLAKIEPQSPQQLANALYRLEGAGMRGAKAMSGLKAAADLAAVGNANVEDTAKTLSQVWFSGIKGAKNLQKVVAEMNATVGAGDMRLQQLVDALGTGIMPVAKNAGLTGCATSPGRSRCSATRRTTCRAGRRSWRRRCTTCTRRARRRRGDEHDRLTGSELGKDFRKKNGLLTALTDLRGHLNKLPGGFRGLKAAQVLSDILPGGRGRDHERDARPAGPLPEEDRQIGGTTGRFGEAVRKTQETAAFKVQARLGVDPGRDDPAGQAHHCRSRPSAFSHFAGVVAKASGALERFGRSKVGGAVKDFASTLTHGAPKPTALPRAKVGAHEEGGLGARRVRAAHEEGGLHVAPPMSKPPPMTGVQKAGLAVRNAIGGVMSWLGRVLPKAGAMLLGLGKQLIQAFKPAMPFFTNVLIPLLKGVAIGVIGAFIGAIKGIIFVVKILAPVLGFLGRVLRPLKGVFQAIGTVIGFVFAGAITKILGLLPKVGGVFRLMGAPIRLIGHLIGGAARIVGRLVSWFVKAHLWALRIAGTIPGAFGRVAKGVGNFVGGVINRIEALVGKIRGLGGKMVAAGGHLIRSIWTGMKNVFKSGLGFAADIGRALANWLNDHTPLGDKVHIGMPWPSPDINFRLPKLATGGHILSGGMAIVGERGPELVNLPGGSTVFDNRTSRRAAASMAGGGAIYVTANLHLSGRQIHSEVFRVDRHIAEMA
jgi:hypothetical protein